MYNLIEAKRSTRKLYTEALVGRGDITQEEAENVLAEYKENLERIFAETHAARPPRSRSSPGSTINDLESHSRRPPTRTPSTAPAARPSPSRRWPRSVPPTWTSQKASPCTPS
ncbi:hypothetical protein [Glutamicibacter nicotianae]|uniref:hypothetical protein n=1 Tax=Glutamicibacter nicotianae TaxID=37929 RepID=UPI001CBE1C87|nr:hypothetical protein [Glutamicibacter nicotianae]